MSVFGPILHPGLLEKAVEEQLRRWMPTYVKRLGEVEGKPFTGIKSYTIVSEYATFPETGLPALVVESAGLVDPPDQDGEGNLSGTFAVEVTVAVQGPNAIATRNAAMNYGTAVLGSLMQHRKLDEGIWVEKCVDLGFAGANVDQRRTRVAIAAVFHVTLENFLNVSEGPLEPTEIPDDWPIAETVTVDVEPKEN